MKTRKELERSNDILFWMVMALLLVILVFTKLDEKKISKLERELQTCQKQVPIWTLKIFCEIEEVGFRTIIEQDFFDYQEYQDVLNNVDEDCEVLE